MNIINQNLASELKNTVKEMKNQLINRVFEETDTIEDDLLIKNLGNGVRFLETNSKK